MLTVAAASASAALAVSTATAQPMEAPGGSGGAAAGVVTPAHDEAGTPASSPRRPATRRQASSGASIRRSPATTRPARPPAESTSRSPPRWAPATPRPPVTSPPRRSTTRRRGVQRGVDQTIPATTRPARPPAESTCDRHRDGHGDATFAARGDRSATAPAIHDEATTAARGVDRTMPGMDEATLTTRGIVTPSTVPRRGRRDRPRDRDAGGRATPAPGSSCPGSTTARPSRSAGLAGAGLLIAAAGFAARRQRPGAA